LSEILIDKLGDEIIGFTDFNNIFYIVIELGFKNDDDNFFHDITILINGLTLAFYLNQKI
jgi:type I site-specific restriction-modification system R (restriction) subunit